MTPAELFTRCGEFLCGLGPKWKEQFGTMLDVRTNTVDNMSKGTSRIPPGIWNEIERLIDGRISDLPALKTFVHNAALKAEQERGMQTSVTSGPAPSPARYRVGPGVSGVAFSPDLFTIMNQRISELDAGHEFKAVKIVPVDNGEAIIEAPRKLPEATLHRVLAWLREVESITGYSIDPLRTTNAQGTFQTQVGEPRPGPRTRS